ncbi:MAG: calycin-like domain-containing protein [Prevotella sp.]|nr:calycin-like domain-containing protein [Prevotella sp.]
MNKIFTFIAACAMSLTAMATDYSDKMAIDLGTGATYQDATVSVNQEEDGTYTFCLKNFVFDAVGTTMAIGNVTLTGITGTVAEDGSVTLEAEGDATVTAGDDESVSFWYGGLLINSVGVTLSAVISNGHLNADITIAYSGMNIAVTFGSEYTEYTDNMSIDMGGEPAIQEATIIVGKQVDGNYSLALNNFSLGGTLGIGNIKLSDIEATEDEDGTVTLQASQAISITAGDDENVSMWMGPMLGEVEVTLTATISNGELYAVINIPYNGNNIVVTFGTEYTNYTGNITVDTGQGDPTVQEATITVGKQVDGTYSLTLKNFVFSGLALGNITLTDIEATENEEGVISLETEQTITITAGDDPTVSFWMGPMLGSLNVSLTAEISEGNLYAVITIPYSGMNIVVTFGENSSSGINTATISNSGVDVIYDMSGRRLNALTKGLNIIRKADGTTVKVLQK